ncbi:type I polyketide synthase [Streptomyces avidinii]|uniref:Acyl transferase domain-containing protein/NAD(P)H-dependent flavin oxidoreductase YrpB (Nitropropane dioxygenase family)/NADP-dependent 3-hydroxy acid dehydrogenase YdfG/acyl carrier protein n=1 Tax=Streptomyces avidinii TaxID=1895 RepID=A0ABS4KZV2_STRAV|nr:type I polyketide synthase [Streptomyces avidinii]MBP2035566.1 acyl transferase domain-containing protein/NAD(P)H-dependent flavin oxidoreductase YrpB (nitropropane dioxygenase family)/NADP-dependent 3-hydroxy acid dehydrogenase YdfG/acyl carrier protein [Streptomyces avidinii]GGZ01545.1 polyketide synthase [Streptomyces avidinii]
MTPHPQPAVTRDLVVAVSPFEEPHPAVVTAAERAGALGLLDLGRDPGAARRAFAELGRRLGSGARYGVRVPVGCPIGPAELPAAVDTVLLAHPDAHTPERVAAWAAAAGLPRVWAEVTSAAEAGTAVAAGSDALVAKGHEAGGRVGSATTFVLLQQLLGDTGIRVPVRACGGIGPHTAAAAVAGGAAGVLLDVQLALTAEGEAGLPEEVAAALRAMDGSETRLADGHRVFARPDLTPPEGPAHTLLGARDLRTQLLPVGQDGASAARLAARYRTTGGVLQAVRAAVAGHLEAAVRVRPLGRPLPVAQGPMTRVSDQAPFAAAVAAAGGIPYLALAVMDGPDVRRLLAETAERLGDLPWGVGLLGFAPPDLRQEQLAAVTEARPPYAIIAGGTPAQAAPLEAAGIRTHLHVPSPGLLERYLAEGARRFVFEGLECGGHVGPRASFPLWEEQIERLLTCPEPEALDVLFAGGIHDERSAAMAVAAAAPLAARGSRVRVLMGTAYLFTEEAVAAGAIRPGFQRAAVECADTVLLRTAPGHATRCAPTPYAETFEATRHRLAESGIEPRTMWEELERLNLGRLRIASKGLRRSPDGNGTEPVTGEQQHSEGLFMLGQAATLRTGTTTIAALHAQVTDGATALLERRARELAGTGPSAEREPQAADPLDIAIVGMACAYPGAPDLAAYWAMVLAGTDAVTEVPAERWDPALYYDADPARAGERTPSRWGGFLGPVPFDALAHGIPPASLAGIEPVQLLALEISARALGDAGYGKDRAFDRSRTSVVFGAEAGTELAGAYGLRALHPAYLGDLPAELDEQLPRLTEDSFPGILANVIAGRVANRLDLGGANCTVDAACASSLAALDLACRQLRDHDSDMVLCGGADVHNGINDYLMFASVRALSPGGRCRPFDAAADGIALGEGVGALVLKRLADAERDGDRVYAVIKAVGAASDGRSLGLTAPRPEGQRRALERAYARAGITAGEVGLIEAHGTGTVVGDSTELSVLSELFTASGAAPGACALGSVKSQLGHTKCAAGLAGLIKAARAVHTGVRPPTLHIDTPNPAWRAQSSPFSFDREARPWAVPAERRIAGVSAFGFGGTNYHAVLAGYGGSAEPRHGLEEWPAELFCFRGEDRRAAGRAMARLAARLEENDAAGRPWALRDLAAETAATGTGAVRVAVVAADHDELAARLERARTFTPGAGVHVREEAVEPGRVAFLFPGQGSQRPGMLVDLFTAFPALRALLDSAPHRVVSTMFPPAAFTARGRTAQRAAVTDTRVAQPALGLAGAAAHLLLGELGVRPDSVAGHSYGELTALWAAGAYDTESLLRLSARRADAIVTAAGADPGSMAAVSAAPEEVGEIAARTGCVVANHNAPRQCVISGPTQAVSAAVTALREAGLTAEPLPVACAFHSEVVAGAAASLGAELATTRMATPHTPVWSNTTADRYPDAADEVRSLVARQVAEPVRFVEQVEAMYAAGVRTFVETGPGRVLSGLVGRILHDRPHTAVPLDVPGEHGLVRLVTAVAELMAAGVPVAPQALFRGRTSRLPERAPRRPGWLVDGHLVRTADGAPVPGGLRPAQRVRAAAPVAATGSEPTTERPRDRREETVLEYLRSTRELVEAQRDVLLGYLGAAPAGPLGRATGAGRGSDGVGSVSGRSPQGAERTAAAPSDPSPRSASEETSRRAPGPVGTAPTGPAPAPPPGPRTAEEVMDLVLEIVHTRTGYPRDMLDPELDLEADLSIDSIKRVEIIGALADRIGLPQNPGGTTESAVEELSRIKTLRGIVDWVTSRSPAAPAAPAPARSVSSVPGNGTAPVPVPVPVPVPDPGAVAPPVSRLRVDLVPVPAADAAPETLRGLRIGLVEDGQGIAPALASALESLGAEPAFLPAAEPGFDGLVDLSALRTTAGPVLPEAFPGLRQALMTGTPRLLLVTGPGTSGAGLHGFARSAALEFPDVLLRAVGVHPKEDPERIAAQLVAELSDGGSGSGSGSIRTGSHETGPIASVGYTGEGTRVARLPVPAPLSSTGGAPDGPPLLDRNAVVLLTGGARGITARTALALARSTGCHVELIGRTPEPATGVDEFGQAQDRVALRAALIAGGLRTPAEIEAAASRILTEREVRATLAALAATAASVRYHCADVTDERAVRTVVSGVRERHGRLDGIVHGAGVLRDGLLRDKQPADFGAVFTTKVAGARHLAAAAAEHGPWPAPRFLALFGSVAGVYGNRGQCDYAAANDALDGLAHAWAESFPGRVLSVDWGPWAAQAGGMVTPELERAYARRGIPLIAPDAGTAAFLDELTHGSDVQVVLMAEGGRGDA